jgi:hypothetical protein
MKKIISALTLSAMVIGSAVADTSFNINYRTFMTAYETSNSDASGKGADSYYWNQAKYSGSYAKDSVTLAASGDIVAFTMTLNPQADATAMIINTLNGYVYLGNLSVYGGWWKDGLLNSNYRVKGDADAGNLDGSDLEGYKLGSIFATSPAKQADFRTGVGSFTKDYTLCYGAQYTYKTDAVVASFAGTAISDRLPGGASITDSAALSGSNYGASGVLDVKIPSVVDVELIGKYTKSGAAGTDKIDVMSFGAYGMPLMVKNLTLAAGGAFGYYDDYVTDYSVDLRAMYVMMGGKLRVTSHNKFGWIGSDDSLAAAAVGKSLLGGTKITGSALTAEKALYNVVEARYKVNNTVTVLGSVSQQTGLGYTNSSDKDVTPGTQLRFFGAGQLYADANDSILVGLEYAIGNINANDGTADLDKTTYLAIPVIFRVKL